MNVIAAPIRVLLVEPHADTRELYHLGLTAAGFDVRTADDAASATVAFVSHAPTVVVTEMRRPDWSDLLTGFAAAGVPVIALTTSPLRSSRLPRSRGGRRVDEALFSRGDRCGHSGSGRSP